MYEFAIYPSFWLAAVDIFLLHNTLNIVAQASDNLIFIIKQS